MDNIDANKKAADKRDFSKIVKFVIQGFIILIVVIVGILFARMLLESNTATNIKEKTLLTGYASSARKHHGRYLEYTNVCSELGLSSGVVCDESETTYRFMIQIDSDNYYCVDQTGFTGAVALEDISKHGCR